MSEPNPLTQALLAVQAELPKLQKTKINPAFRSKYVPLEELHEEVMPLLHAHGLVWLTMPASLNDTDPTPGLAYHIIHAESGEGTGGWMPLVLAKNDPQGQGSAITYARRYALMAVLGLVADNDDDGNAASGRAKAPKRRETRGGQKTRATSSNGQSGAEDGSEQVTEEQRKNIAALATGLGWTPRSSEFREVLDAHAKGKGLKDLTSDEAAEVIMHLAKLTQEKGAVDAAA